ncbi:hypothetical protein C8J56DRAFT_880484 [Mycena floridula]|nr:hypothetical protein C8J56DRAFT_880484 [Mycena floridula]
MDLATVTPATRLVHSSSIHLLVKREILVEFLLTSLELLVILASFRPPDQRHQLAAEKETFERWKGYRKCVVQWLSRSDLLQLMEKASRACGKRHQANGIEEIFTKTHLHAAHAICRMLLRFMRQADSPGHSIVVHYILHRLEMMKLPPFIYRLRDIERLPAIEFYERQVQEDEDWMKMDAPLRLRIQEGMEQLFRAFLYAILPTYSLT